ncbi:MAG: ATP-dependent zinc metalloprotease FtsH [Planctomycetes bacterium]|nr:ATP-dependent zinc metalloprotease FtsH [Planctomycetota bacterium]
MGSDYDKDKIGPPPPGERGGGSQAPQRPRIGRQLLLWLLVMGAVLVGVSMFKRLGGPPGGGMTVKDFYSHMDSGKVAALRIRGTHVTVTLKGAEGPTGKKQIVLPEEEIARKLEKWSHSVPSVDYKESDTTMALVLWNILPLLLLVVLMLYFFNRHMRSVGAREGWMPFVGNSTEKARKEKPDVRFDDVAGVQEAKEEVQEIVEFLRNPEKFQVVGGRIPRGILLVGAPGTGKTLLAQAIAGEADVPFYSLCGSDFVELFVGVGAARVRDLFRKARENQPSIIFLDEIDAVGRKRGTGLGGGHDEREQTLNAILSEMDGFTRDTGIIVLAATNRPDVLDPALLRPGRFDREIMVDMPDVRGREAILKVHARGVKMAGSVILKDIARGTPGFTGADLEALINEAAIRAAMQGQQKVSMANLEEARDKVRFGRQKKHSRVMSAEDKKLTAYHEAGHALIAKLHEDVEPLHKVTIIPRGVAMGMTMVLPEKDKYGLRKRECFGQIIMMMAGRVAEEMFCGDISSGAEDDIEKATELARSMITRWGMSKELGPISYAESERHVFLGNEITRGKLHSERMAEKIDEEVRLLLMECYQMSRQMCEENADGLRRIAEVLLELETLSGDEVARILAGDGVDELRVEREAAEKMAAAEQAREEEKEKEPVPESDEGAAPEEYPRPLGSPA